MLKHIDRTTRILLVVLAVVLVGVFMWALTRIEAGEPRLRLEPGLQVKPLEMKPLSQNNWMNGIMDDPDPGGKCFSRESCSSAGHGSCALQGSAALQIQYRQTREDGMIRTTCNVPCTNRSLPSFNVRCSEGDPNPPADPEPTPTPPCNCDDGPCPDGCPS